MYSFTVGAIAGGLVVAEIFILGIWHFTRERRDLSPQIRALRIYEEFFDENPIAVTAFGAWCREKEAKCGLDGTSGWNTPQRLAERGGLWDSEETQSSALSETTSS